MSQAESASARSEMDAVSARLCNYTRDIRPFAPGADANENAAMWQTFESSLADDVPVLANPDGDHLDIPVPPSADHDTQNRIVLRLRRKCTSGESRVIVDGATDSLEAVVKLRARFAGDGPMERLCALVYTSTAAALVAEHAMLLKQLRDDGEAVPARRQAQTFYDAISPKRAGSSFVALFARWTLDKPEVGQMYAEIALYAELNDLNNQGLAPVPTGRLLLPCARPAWTDTHSARPDSHCTRVSH